MRTISDERPEGLSGLDLFAAARPTKAGQQIESHHGCLPGSAARVTGISLAHLLLGTDLHPEAALFGDMLRDFRRRVHRGDRGRLAGELLALTPATLDFSQRRRRRLRDRSRRGDDLRRTFEQIDSAEVELAEMPPSSDRAFGRHRVVDGRLVNVAPRPRRSGAGPVRGRR